MLTVYLVGEPGAGKTTLMNAIMSRVNTTHAADKPVKHLIHDYNGKRVVSLGWPRPPFGGTDTLGHSAINLVEQLLLPILEATETQILLGEGDRLATNRFLYAAQDYGQLLLLHLPTSPEVAQQRRIERAEASNIKPQNASWVKGRATKVTNLVAQHEAVEINWRDTLEQQVATVWTLIENRLQ